ncbi:indolepyruvate ferredoxin oxidoreductase subunit beta [Thermoplasmatales archaeon ex4484_30]|nr:MAG: indolepyruvate ferredoxin oxidoreductase subunit beta [Thermoplasmatales archaeon ex4484_30]
MKKSILFTGVGGQGVLTMANILAKAALEEGFHVLTSEVHGMAQRGGSVVCHVRIGNIHSPLIPDGGADAIVSMEPLEALRHIEKISKDGIVLTDITPVIPPNVSIGKAVYPPLEKIFGEMAKKCKLVKIDALKIAKEAGNAITRNIVMLGALAEMDVFPVSKEKILSMVKKSVPEKYVALNEKAFVMGGKAVK